MLRPVRNDYKPPSPSPLNSPSRGPAAALGAGGWGRGRGSSSSSSSSSKGQWWRGALVGAVSALIACGAGRLLLGGGGSGGGGGGDTQDLAEEEIRNHDGRCPVFNAVTGETKVPDDSKKKIETLIKPGKAYPIQSQDWATRVYAAKSARSQASKGAAPEEIGRAALSKRLAARQQQGPREESGGTAAVLTLLVADAKKPQPFLSALGRRQSWGPEYRATTAAAGAGEAEWAWEEVFVCEEDETALDGILGSLGEGEAWREALERGMVKLVPCSSGGADERRAGELSLACAAGDASVAEFVWLPGPGVAEALGMADAKLLTPSGRGAEVAAELSRVATATGVEGVFGVRGWQRTQDAPRPKRQRRGLLVEAGNVVGGEPRRGVPEPAQPAQPESAQPEPGGRRRSLLKAFQRTGRDEPWQFVGGAGAGAGGDDGAGLVEVDALTDALFVRGAHLRHACALLRNAGTSGRATSRRLPMSYAGDGSKDGTRSDFVDGQREEEEEEEDEISQTLDRHRRREDEEQKEAEQEQEQEEQEQEQEGEISPDRHRRRRATTMAKTTGNEAAAANSAMSFMKLPAVSYVLRKTLGVRSYASSELLPWGGPDGGKVRWSWGGGKGDDNLGNFEASVPGSQFLPWECLSRSGLEPVLLSVTDLRDLRAIKPLLEGFQSSGVYDAFVVLSGPAVAAARSSAPTFRAELEATMVSAGGMHDSRVGVGGFGGKAICGVLELGGEDGAGGEGNLAAQAQWAALLNRVSPVAVVAVSRATATMAESESAGLPRQGLGRGDSAEQRATRRACAEADAEIAYVLLPEDDVPHSLWLARLAPAALSSWSRPRFSVSIITNDRPRSLARLLGSLRRSRLFGDEMAVDFYIESSADDETLGVAERFSSVWGDRGQVQTHFRVLKGGLIRAVTESFFPSDSHHHAFLLEDDIEVSPHFYAWAKWATLTYQYGAPPDFMENMYGVSLYTPRVDELNRKRQVYDSNKLIASIPGGAKYLPYLHQLPCSWGALYFPETWREYRLYLAARLREDHISVNIDGSRTNKWKTSWKRFFIEMAYQAQYYMLYPNYYNQTSFATNWLEAGEHIKVGKDKAKDGKPAPAAPKGDSTHLPKDYTVPLMKDEASLVTPLPRERLPALESLPRLDVLNRIRKKREG